MWFCPILQKCSAEFAEKIHIHMKISSGKLSSKRPVLLKCNIIRNTFVARLLCRTLESKLLVIALKIFKTVKLIVIESIFILKSKYALFEYTEKHSLEKSN